VLIVETPLFAFYTDNFVNNENLEKDNLQTIALSSSV